jgi:stress-induced-phosphoprotein 1
MSAVESLKAQGNKAFADKKYTEAIQFYTDAIDMDKDDYRLYSNRSGSYCTVGRHNLAEADARQVIQLKPDWARGYTRLGAALAGQKKWDEAVAAYEKAQSLDPGNAGIAIDLEDARAAAGRDRDGTFSPQVLESLRSNPSFADPSFVAIFDELKVNSQLAFQKYARDPRFHQLLQALAEGQCPADATSPQGEAEREKELGNAALQSGRLEDAIVHYDRAIGVDRHNVTLFNNKAVVLLKQGRYQEAIDLVRAAIDDGRAHGVSSEAIAKAYQKIASAYAKLNNLDGAIEALTASLVENKDPVVSRQLRALQDQRAKQYENPELAEKARQEGNTAFKDGKFPEAIALYSEAIKRAPRMAALYSNRAAAYSKLGEFPMALADCDKALELDPGFVKAHTRKGYCHFMMKEYYKARDCYRRARSIDANNSEAIAGLEEVDQALARQRGQGADEEQVRCAMADPEIRRIVQDPGMQQILEDMKEHPENARNYFADPTIRERLFKLRDAGILRF